MEEDSSMSLKECDLKKAAKGYRAAEIFAFNFGLWREFFGFRELQTYTRHNQRPLCTGREVLSRGNNYCKYYYQVGYSLEGPATTHHNKSLVQDHLNVSWSEQGTTISQHWLLTNMDNDWVWFWWVALISIEWISAYGNIITRGLCSMPLFAGSHSKELESTWTSKSNKTSTATTQEDPLYSSSNVSA